MHTRWLWVSVFFALVACRRPTQEAPAQNTQTTATPTRTATPTPTPPAPVTPLTNEPIQPLPSVQTDTAKVTLGRRLFHDTQLSGDNTVSCASCHSLDTGGAEHRRTSLGIRQQVGPINAPTVLNAGFNFVQFWDGRAANLQAQAAGPVANPAEMGATWEQVVTRIRNDASYRDAFQAVYQGTVSQDNITNAIAEYERSLVTPSRFDRYLQGHADAITDTERRGYETFKRIGCTTCHNGVNVGGSSYQRMGARRDYFAQRGNLTDADNGRFNVTHAEGDRHQFKVPTLRNIEHTAPYLHDGTQQTLDDVVRVMGRFQLDVELNSDQIYEIVAFLRSLSGELPAHARMQQTAAAPAAPAH